jgi:LacI family transcriptional regulator
VLLVVPPRDHMYSQHIVDGAIAEAQFLGLSVEIMEDVTSDSPAGAIEAAIKQRFAAAEPLPDAIISASTTGAMASATGAEALGLVLGVDFDLVAKEAIPFLHRFRKAMIVVHEDVNRAGDSLARAVMAAIEGRTLDEGLRLEVPTKVEPGPV